MPGRRQTSPEVLKAMAWMNNYSKASKWMQRYDIHRLLDDGGGIVRIEDFLPPFVAEAVLQVLQAIPTAKWNPTAAGEDYAQNNISHQFYSTKHASAIIEAAVRVVGLLLPGQLSSFSAARYDATHHIAPHDDRAYTDCQMDTGEIVTCSREIGLIWYLTKDWRPEFGGALVDLEAPGGPKTYVPLFNSAVAFRVPRFHEVRPLTTSRPRYSLFGWFLQPGRRYELYLGQQTEQAQQGQQTEQAQQGQQQAEELGTGEQGPRRGGGAASKKGGKRRRGQQKEAAEGSGRGDAEATAAGEAVPQPQGGRISIGVSGSGMGGLEGGKQASTRRQQQKRKRVGGVEAEAAHTCKLAQRIAENAARRAQGEVDEDG